MSDDVVDQLARYGDAAEAAVGAAMRARVPRRLPGRRRPLGLWAAVAAVVIVGLLATLVATDRSADDAKTPTAGSTPVDRSAPGTWTTLPPAPIVPTGDEVVVATDDELVVWSAAGGAAWSFDDESWRAIAPSGLTERRNAVVVWTGKEVVVWGGHRSTSSEDRLFDGAAYDPATDTWRSLPEQPWSATRGRTGAVMGDREVVFVGVQPGPGANLASDTYALDPTTGEWRALPRSPIPASVPHDPHLTNVALSTGGEELLVVSASGSDTNPRIDHLSLGDDEGWGETVWTAVSGPNLRPQDVAWTGDRLAIVRPSRAVSYDPHTGEINSHPRAVKRDDLTRIDLPTVAVGGLVVSGEQYLDTATGTWYEMAPTPSPSRSQAQAVEHDGSLYVWGGRTCPTATTCSSGTKLADGLVWQPPGDR